MRLQRWRGPVASLLALFLSVAIAQWTAPSARAADATMHLYGRFAAPMGWSTTPGGETDPGPTLTVDQGDIVTLTLTSEDGSAHTFWIDYNSNGVADSDEPNSPVFTGTATYTFVASRAGTFTYWCGIHHPTMRGIWVTNAADVMSPTVSSLSVNPVRASPGGFVNLTASATDDTAVTSVAVHVVGPRFDQNLTMVQINATTWYLNRTYGVIGTYTATVWVADARGNLGFRDGSFMIGSLPVTGIDPLPIALFAVLLAALAAALVWRSRRPRGRV